LIIIQNWILANCRMDKLQEISKYCCFYVPHIVYQLWYHRLLLYHNAEHYPLAYRGWLETSLLLVGEMRLLLYLDLLWMSIHFLLKYHHAVNCGMVAALSWRDTQCLVIDIVSCVYFHCHIHTKIVGLWKISSYYQNNIQQKK
jgi:hypothetical protein